MKLRREKYWRQNKFVRLRCSLIERRTMNVIRLRRNRRCAEYQRLVSQKIKNPFFNLHLVTSMHYNLHQWQLLYRREEDFEATVVQWQYRRQDHVSIPLLTLPVTDHNVVQVKK